jgi:hypothetical protein
VLLGRGPEAGRLDELIRDAASGRGGALVIEGEPGGRRAPPGGQA